MELCYKVNVSKNHKEIRSIHKEEKQNITKTGSQTKAISLKEIKDNILRIEGKGGIKKKILIEGKWGKSLKFLII